MIHLWNIAHKIRGLFLSLHGTDVGCRADHPGESFSSLVCGQVQRIQAGVDSWAATCRWLPSRRFAWPPIGRFSPLSPSSLSLSAKPSRIVSPSKGFAGRFMVMVNDGQIRMISDNHSYRSRCLTVYVTKAGSLPQQNVTKTGGRRRCTAMCSTSAPSRSACGGQALTSLRGGPFSRGRRSERDSAAPVTNQNIERLPQEDRTVDLLMGANHGNIPN